LRTAVVDAAGVGYGLWFSYLFVLLYFAITTGAVTHRDLLLENPVKLPFLNVELALEAFFVLGPLIFLVVHTYVLLHFLLLAGKVGAFHAELQKQIPGDEEKRTQLRRQLPSNGWRKIFRSECVLSLQHWRRGNCLASRPSRRPGQVG
jgi:hypothetical protein